MLKQSVVLICSLSFVLSLPQAALACLCGHVDVEGAFLVSDVVLVGKVVRITRAKEASVGWWVGRNDGTQVPRWKQFVSGVRIVTLEVSEGFKGVSDKRIEVVTAAYNGGGSCGVNFRMGESYLVYAEKRRASLSVDQRKLPKAEWTTEVRLKAAADKFNERLPTLETNICAKTKHRRWANEDVQVIRLLLNM